MARCVDPPMSILFRCRAVAAGLTLCLALTGCPHPRTPPPSPDTSEDGRLTAVLINGGGNKQSNFQSHLTHVRTLVGLLRDAGVPAEDIAVFASDGNDPAVDLATRSRAEPGDECWLIPEPLADHLRPVEYVDSRLAEVPLLPASRAALQTWFATAGKNLRSGDTLLLYVTDHGELNSGYDPSKGLAIDGWSYRPGAQRASDEGRGAGDPSAP